MRLLFISPKDVYATHRIIEECQRQGIDVVHRLASNLAGIETSSFDVLYARMVYPFYKQVGELAAKFKAEGKFALTAPDVDKLSDYQKLKKAGLPLPETKFFDEHQFKTPFVLKTKYGFGKKEVFLISSDDDLNKIKNSFPPDDLIIQKFIPADFEYKVICVGYKALPKVLKFKIDSSGLGIINSEYEVLESSQHQELVSLAEKASEILKRELSKVDILQKGSQYYVLEVNRSPGLKSFETLTKINVAAKFVNYLKEKSDGPYARNVL